MARASLPLHSEAAAAEATRSGSECLGFPQASALVGYVGHKRQSQHESCAQGTDLSGTVSGQRPA